MDPKPAIWPFKMFLFTYIPPGILNIKLTLDVKLDGAVYTCITLQLTDKDNSVVLFSDRLYTQTTSGPAVFFCQVHLGTIAEPLQFILVGWLNTFIINTSQSESFLNLCPKQVPGGQWTWLNGDCCLERINYWAICSGIWN